MPSSRGWCSARTLTPRLSCCLMVRVARRHSLGTLNWPRSPNCLSFSATRLCMLRASRTNSSLSFSSASILFFKASACFGSKVRSSGASAHAPETATRSPACSTFTAPQWGSGCCLASQDLSTAGRPPTPRSCSAAEFITMSPGPASDVCALAWISNKLPLSAPRITTTHKGSLCTRLSSLSLLLLLLSTSSRRASTSLPAGTCTIDTRPCRPIKPATSRSTWAELNMASRRGASRNMRTLSPKPRRWVHTLAAPCSCMHAEALEGSLSTRVSVVALAVALNTAGARSRSRGQLSTSPSAHVVRFIWPRLFSTVTSTWPETTRKQCSKCLLAECFIGWLGP
mmetsp:Transcript_13854/g.26591  ORF Transcript_13854/g.26591 Transcript_13854/m.26591 type:complete len:341 (-) Transcript_13854:59-1081(-)